MEEEIKKAVEVLQLGGNLLYPTDTIWGIGCDATNFRAVEKVQKLKRRTLPKPMIILVANIDMLKQYVQEIPEVAIDLIQSVTDPLTIIYPQSRNLPKNLVAPDQSVAIRIPRNEFCQKLVKDFGKPITSTSANISGERSPLSFSKVADEIRQGVDYVVDFRQEMINGPKPSTIVRITRDGEMQILRN